MTVSALIIARNEEKKIFQCLKALKFADEIILVLDRSEDNTYDISKKITNKIYRGNWELEGDRRNYGIEKCSFDWVLEVDADEIINKNLAKEILDITENSKFDFHYIPLINYIDKKKCKHGWMACLAPDGKFCLFKKNNKKWMNKRVHPEYALIGKRGEQLYHQIDHMMADNISDLIKRFNRNTSLHAQDLLTSNKRYSKYFSKRKIFSRFLKSYFLRKGFKNGSIGIILAILCALYPFISAIKAREKEKQKL